MAQDCYRKLTFLQLLGCLLWLTVAFVRGDGRLFLLERKNGTAVAGGGAAAQEACSWHGARLATLAELRRAVVECSFSTCTRGWLAGPSIGTTVCNQMSSGQQPTKTVTVKVENATATSSHLDVFCMKEKGGPCGDPPSFTHTVLQSHTGLELGDELLYVCAPGYAMPSGHTAFSLLCDSCGEWYGHVQHCVKVPTETQIDYEIPDESRVSHEDLVDRDDDDEETGFSDDDGLSPKTEVVSESELDQEQDSSPGEEMSAAEEEHRAGVREEVDIEDSTEQISQGPTTGTEAPVSLLSQKHLFWFPSETFHEPDQPRIPDVTVAPSWAEDEDNHIGVKTSGSEIDSVKAYGERDSVPLNTVKTGPINYTQEAAREKEPETDESWLDGYPVTQEAGEEKQDAGSLTTDTGEEDKSGRKVPSRTNHVDGSRHDDTSSAQSLDSSHIVASPTRPGDYGVKYIPVRLTPHSSPESVDVGLRPTTRHSTVVHTHTVRDTPATPEPDIPSHRADRGDDLGVPPTGPWYTTKSLYPFLDHLPGPTEWEEVTVPYQKSPSGTVFTKSISEFAGTSLHEESVGRNETHLGPGAEVPTTEGPCMGEGCTLGGWGPIVTIIIVAVCALVLVAVLAIWCYKKRQQKSSVYKMNGKGQTRHPQQIEMQQKV